MREKIHQLEVRVLPTLPKSIFNISKRFILPLMGQSYFIECPKCQYQSKEIILGVTFLFGNVENILDTLNYRSNTLKDVIEQILLVQGNFLSNKSEFLNPLKLEDIANKIDKDISSISRVVKNKYIDTPIGLISLKSLFSNALTKKSGKTASTNELKKVMLEIIDAEDKKSPLSDSDIVEKLNEKDFLIARRTVAKYRKLLDIKNVNQRIEK